MFSQHKMGYVVLSKQHTHNLCEDGIEKSVPGYNRFVMPDDATGEIILSHPHTHNGFLYELRHEISNNVVCATSKGSDKPAHGRSLIRAFASRLNIL